MAFIMKELNTTKLPKITVFGVGTAGCGLLDILADSDIGDKVKLVAVDEKGGGLPSSKADVKIMLFKDEPFAFRPGLPPLSRARDGALKVYDEIIEALKQ